MPQVNSQVTNVPRLPPIPQSLPKTQAEWDRFVNAMQQWARLLANAAAVFSGNASAVAETLSGTLTVNGTGTALTVAHDASVGGNLGVTGTITGGTYNGQTIGSAASLTGSLTVAGALTVSTGGSTIKGNFVVPVSSGNYGVTIAPSATAQITGVQLQDAFGSRTVEFLYIGASASTTYGASPNTSVMNAQGALTLSVADVARLSINSSGNVTINAPSSGTTLAVNGIANALTASFQASTAASQSLGMRVFAGTNSSDEAFRVFNAAGNQTYLEIRGDGLLTAVDDGGTMQAVGWRGTPFTTPAGNYTLALSDRGKAIYTTAVSPTFTIPASVFSAGDVVTIIYAGSSGSLTIAQGPGFTLLWANGTTGSIGNRILAGYGIATLIFNTSNEALITGSGLS